MLWPLKALCITLHSFTGGSGDTRGHLLFRSNSQTLKKKKSFTNLCIMFMTQPQQQFEAQNLLEDAQTARSRVQNKSLPFICTFLMFLRHCWPFTRVHKNTWGRLKDQAEESSSVCWDQIWVVRAPHSAHHHKRTADAMNRTSGSVMLCGCCKAEAKMKTPTIIDPGGRSASV